MGDRPGQRPGGAGSRLRHSLLERTPERDLLPRARAFDLTVFAWAPLAAGLLTGTYRRGEAGQLDAFGQTPQSREEDVVSAVPAVAAEGGRSAAQVAPA
ncbi:aldo/keto reductase [Streptomyces pyxinicus]|uniref:aldo/keto reductase n=1 Tax=Streptomyces pyxinicus TaxID=2970331 RepID=UPI003D16A6FC